MLPVVSVRGRRRAVGFQKITLTGVVQLQPKGCDTIVAVCQPETTSVRWRDDGVAPDANTGMLLTVNSIYEFNGDLDAVQFIGTAANATMNVTYYGPEIV
jgi:hypothetical protein